MARLKRKINHVPLHVYTIQVEKMMLETHISSILTPIRIESGTMHNFAITIIIQERYKGTQEHTTLNKREQERKLKRCIIF